MNPGVLAVAVLLSISAGSLAIAYRSAGRTARQATARATALHIAGTTPPAPRPGPGATVAPCGTCRRSTRHALVNVLTDTGTTQTAMCLTCGRRPTHPAITARIPRQRSPR